MSKVGKWETSAKPKCFSENTHQGNSFTNFRYNPYFTFSTAPSS